MSRQEAPRTQRRTQPTGFAFFDFDNTVIHGDAGPMFGAWLYRLERQDSGRRRRAGMALRYVPFVTWMGIQATLYKVRARRRSELVRSAYKGLRGMSAERFFGELDAFIDAEIPARIYPEVREVMKVHQKAGRRCVIITTGLEHLVHRATRHLPGEAGDIDVIGCTMGEKNGRLTGHVGGPLYGADKANILSAYCRAAGIDTDDCWAYTDHYSDFHMLEAVGHPVCVNPRGRLEKMAQERAWQVLRAGDPRSGHGTS